MAALSVQLRLASLVVRSLHGGRFAPIAVLLAMLLQSPAPVQAGYYYAWGGITGGSCMEVAIKRHDGSYGASAYGYGYYTEFADGGCEIYSLNASGGKRWLGVADYACDDDLYTKRVNGTCVPFSPACYCTTGTGAGGPNPSSGNPINALGRSKHEHVVDFTTGGPLPLLFERYYGRYGEGFSRANDYSRLGAKWRTGFDAIMTSRDSGTTLIITLPDGADIVFYLTAGAYVEKEYLITPPALGGAGYADLKTRLGTHNSLVKVGTDYQLTTADDRVWTFDASYRLTQIVYRGGYTQTLGYDSAGNNTSVTDNLGRTITMTYNIGGLLTQATMPDGSVLAYTYKSVMNPAMTVPTGGWPTIKQGLVLETVSQVGVSATTTTYHYENTAFAAALTGVTDARGIRYATFGYDSLGRAVSTQHNGGVDLFTFTYDLPNKKAKITNPLSKVTTYTYSISSSGRARVTTVTGEPSSNCPTSTGTYTYDSNNFVATHTDEEGRVTAYVNNSRGLSTSITRGYGTPQAVTTSYTYHATLHVPTQMVDPHDCRPVSHRRLRLRRGRPGDAGDLSVGAHRQLRPRQHGPHRRGCEPEDRARQPGDAGLVARLPAAVAQHRELRLW